VKAPRSERPLRRAALRVGPTLVVLAAIVVLWVLLYAILE